MELGMIGLGRMGANMARRLMRAGHSVTGFDPEPEARSSLESEGAQSAESLMELTKKLPAPRVVWLMVPAGKAVEAVLDELSTLLQAGDLIVDGGNSNYRDSQRRGHQLEKSGLQFVDVGTSGGVWGLEEGYSMMVGGASEAVQRLRPALESLAPAADRGWGHVGPVGSGHFVKMIHNGIEYGMMQAMAEGFAIMERKPDYELDLAQVAEIWRHGSVVRSWLLDLTARALADDDRLGGIEPWVSDSGEGRWTVQEAIDLDVSAPVITLSLLERFGSRERDSYAYKLLAAMRNQFGGHAMKKKAD